MSALTELVKSNLETARRGLAGRGTDERVTKASKPLAQQIDQPAGLGNTPPTTQAHDMFEGIDLTSPTMLNTMYQRYGPAFMHAAVKKHRAQDLHSAAQHPDLHPRVKVLLHAAAAVRKAFEGGRPALGGPAQFPDSTPSVQIPSRPSHGAPGKPITTYPATVGNTSRSAPTAAPNPGAITQEPQTAGSASRTTTGPQSQPVCRQWLYQPASGNPVAMPEDKDPGGTADDDKSYNGSRHGSFVGPVNPGDLVHFNGPGGSAFTAKVTQVTTGAVIGEFAGQTVQFPTESIFPHNVGGSDHAPTSPAAPSGGSPAMPARGGKVAKAQRDAIYHGGQDMTSPHANLPVKSPDDGATLTPYNAQRPYSPEEGEQSGAAPGNNANGYLTPRERTLIERVMNHKNPTGTEVAVLKALRGNAVGPEHAVVIKEALRRHAMAVPANREVARSVAAKL